jgi:hypothetical protein
MPVDCLNDNLPVYDPDENGCYRWMSIRAGKPSKFCARLTIGGDLNVPEPECIRHDGNITFEPPLSTFLLNPDPPHGLVSWHDFGDRVFTHRQANYTSDADKDPEHTEIFFNQIIQLPGYLQPVERLRYYKMPFNVNTETPQDLEILGGPKYVSWTNNTDPLKPSLGYGNWVLKRSGVYRFTINLATSEGLGNRVIVPEDEIAEEQIRRPAMMFKVAYEATATDINRDDISTVTPPIGPQGFTILANLNSRSEESVITEDDGADDHVSVITYFELDDDQVSNILPWSLSNERGLPIDVYYRFVDNNRPTNPPSNRGWVRLFDDKRFGGSQIGIKWIGPYRAPVDAIANEFGGLPPGWNGLNQYRNSLYRIPGNQDPGDLASTFRYRPA